MYLKEKLKPIRPLAWQKKETDRTEIAIFFKETYKHSSCREKLFVLIGSFAWLNSKRLQTWM